MSRAKGRDLFDIWYLLSKGIEIDWTMVNRKMALYKKEIISLDILNKIKKMDQKKLKIDLGKFLPLNQRKISENIQEMLLEKLK